MSDNNLIVIAPSYIRKDIMKELISKDDNPFDKQVLSLNAYKNSLLLEPLDKNEEKSKLYNDIKNYINKDNIFYNQLKFPIFFNYFYDFSQLLIKYEINIDDLPEEDNQDKAKKEILSYFLSQELIEKQIRNNLDKINDLSNIEIYDYFYKDLFNKKDIDKLIEKKAKLIKIKDEKKTIFKCRYANNSIKEVLGLAQMIVKNKNDINLNEYLIMLNNKDEYIPIIRRIFDYYKIPYKLKYHKNNKEAQRFLSLLELIRLQDIDSFIKAYNNGCFFESNNHLIDYISNTNLNYDDLFNDFNSINNLLNDKEREDYIINTFGINHLKQLAKQEEIVNNIMHNIRPVLNDIKKINKEAFYKQCSFVYNYLYSKLNSNSLNKDTINEIEAIHNLCITLVNKEYDNYDLLKNELLSLTSIKNIEYENGIRIVDVYEDIDNYNKAIILGCIQQNYPISIALSGFFDEEYVSRINNYPNILERNDYFIKQYDKLLHNFDEVIFSYPISSVDGDKYQRSILISDYVEKDAKNQIIEETWEYNELDTNVLLKDNIKEKSARELYLKDNILYASPSAFEQYVKCPFSYFIKRGLKLEDELTFDIENSTIGSIQHSLLEKSFKEEIDLNENNIEELLKPYFDLIKDVVKNKDDEIDATRIRLAKGLKKSISFLNNFKKVDDYKYYPEAEINNFSWKLKDNEICFNGKIDRLDIKDNNYRIIDYKSSEKSVSLSKVKKGINFQLLSYLVIYYLKENNPKLNPELFAYLSLKNSKLDKEYGKEDKEIRYDDVKYSTYMTSNINEDENYFECNIIDGRGKNALKNIDYETVEDIIKKLFTSISEKILSGDISIEPKNGACLFCEYSDLCHFNGDELSIEEMEDLVEGKE